MKNSKLSRGTLSSGSSDEESCYAPSPVPSTSMYLYYRGLSSTPKKAFWVEYLYGRDSADSGVNAETALQTGTKPVAEDNA